MLQRSVTDTRRLPSGRLKVSRISGMDRRSRGARRSARWIDPHLGAVEPHLLLPHGDAALDLLDDVAARLERLRPVWGRDDDRDARLARGDRADPMPHAGP